MTFSFPTAKVSILFCVFMLTACAATSRLNPDLEASIAWYLGTTGRVDDARAHALLESAAASGDILSTMWMARVYSTGRMEFERNPGLAREIAGTVIAGVEHLAMAGNAEAQFLMGTACAEGLGRAIDPVAAVTWYEKAASQNHTLAQHNLGNVHASGTGVSQDAALAVFWWRKAAEAGDAIPQYRLAVSYEQGQGVAQDRDAAARWYRDAAARGNANARAALERLNLQGYRDGPV